jgi:hypothetical protein
LGIPIPDEMSGKNMADVLSGSQRSGRVKPTNNVTYFGKERHDLGRSNEDGDSLTYPVRAIRKDNFFYARNFKPERWPVGNPEYGFRNADDCPTKQLIVNMRFDYPINSYFFELNFGFRAPEELYDLSTDPACVKNLAYKPEYAEIRKSLWAELKDVLTKQQDPQILGNGAIFEQYQYLGPPKERQKIEYFED